jgi:uncharacterized protein involved in type VI secretion and phage assembly
VSRYYGKYRGTVTDNVDPEQLGRVRVSVPAVYVGGRLSWALPAVPYAGPGVGLFLVPPVGANVWVEFEGGDPESAIWSGCFWGVGQVPVLPALAQLKVLKTDFATITVDDTTPAGGVTIETTSGFSVTLGPLGIDIDAGQGRVSIQGLTVTVNNGALEVT